MAEAYETGRLLLRCLEEDEAQAVLDFFLRNRLFLKEWEPARGEDFFTLEAQRKQLACDRLRREAGELLRLWVFRKGGAARPVGSVAFDHIVRGAFLSCHLGYRIDRAEINQGFATEAIARGIDVMFRDYGLHRIEANVMPRNRSSLRVLEKLGFCPEGLARRYLRINGRWEDHVHMVRLNEDE